MQALGSCAVRSAVNAVISHGVRRTMATNSARQRASSRARSLEPDASFLSPRAPPASRIPSSFTVFAGSNASISSPGLAATERRASTFEMPGSPARQPRGLTREFARRADTDRHRGPFSPRRLAASRSSHRFAYVSPPRARQRKGASQRQRVASRRREQARGHVLHDDIFRRRQLSSRPAPAPPSGTTQRASRNQSVTMRPPAQPGVEHARRASSGAALTGYAPCGKPRAERLEPVALERAAQPRAKDEHGLQQTQLDARRE